MKELSIEGKAKRYDEAINRIKHYVADEYGCSRIKVADVFPEFKESEDEKTERILHSISSKISFHLRDIFTEEEFQCFDTWSNAWFKKQRETSNYNPYKETIKSISTMVDKYTQFGSDLQDFYDNVKVKCKDAIEYDRIFIEKQGEQKPYASETMNEKGDFDNGFTRIMENGQKPTECKEKKYSKCYVYNLPHNDEMCEQCEFNPNNKKSAEWSEEDEKQFVKELQSLMLEWSNSKENMGTCIYRHLDKLISIRSQNTWKPSEGQLECLGYAIEKAEKDWSPLTNNRIYLTLKALKEQLKKLKE